MVCEIAPLAKQLSTDPWTLLWRTPYVQLLQFLHWHLRQADVWTVAESSTPAAVVSDDEIDELLEA